MILFFSVLLGLFVIVCLLVQARQKNSDNNILENCQLSIEKIEMIHSKGMLTPAEKVMEWESIGLCAPGDAIGSAAHRCKKFHNNCHNCLVDFANQNDEHESIFNNFKIITNK